MEQILDRVAGPGSCEWGLHEQNVMVALPLLSPRRPRRAPGVVFLMAALVLGFGSRSVRGQEPPTPPVEQLERRVQSIFAEGCARAGCHAGPSPQEGMNLSPNQFYESIVGQPSQEKPHLLRVHPGKPDSSYLVHKIERRANIEGAAMPLVGDPLSDDEISTIRQWITNLEEEDERRMASSKKPAAFPFNGWRLMNLPTTRSLDGGSHLFLISHRFNPTVNQGYDALYGLDGSSIIKLSVGHAFTDRFRVLLGRSNASDNVELSTHYQIAQQWGERQWPLGVSVHNTLNWVSEAPPEGESRYRSEAVKYTAQLSLARLIGDRFGVMVVPGVTVNPAEGVDDENVLVTLGLGGRVHVYGNVNLFAEWVPILSGFVRTRTFGNENRFDSWGGGVEIAVGGHVFQVVISNSVGVTTDQSLRGGDLDIQDFFDGDFRLGFNIYRVLNF